MNINRLRNLLVLSEEGNFSRAAERVHLSQPALSRSIQALESELGMSLFDRDPKGIVLTAPGRIAVEHARRILREASALTQDIDLLKRYRLGKTTFGAGPHLAAAWVPGLLAQVIEHYPELKIVVEIANADVLLDQLQNERIDFFISTTTDLIIDAELVVTRLPAPELACFVAAGHPLLKERAVDFEQLAGYAWLSTRTTSLIRDGLFATISSESQHQLIPAVICEDLLLLVKTALQTQAILVAPYGAVRDELDTGRLLPLALDPTLFKYTDFALVRLARRTPSPAAALLMSMIDAMQPVHAGLPSPLSKGD